jgi:hypothetical protein
MLKKILIILSGCGLLYSATIMADAQMFKSFESAFTKIYSRCPRYNEFLIRGYDVQPNRPGVWYTGCRTDDYYCMGNIERLKFEYEIIDLERFQSRRMLRNIR